MTRNITISVSDDLGQRMKAFPDANWSEICRQSIKDYIDKRAQNEAFLSNEESLKDIVGTLISVLHGKYSDTRELAVVQLALLGEKATPHICSYLKDEAKLEEELIKYCETYNKWKTLPQNVSPPINERARYSEEELESIKMQEAMREFERNFESKWNHHPVWYLGYTSSDESKGGLDYRTGRMNAVNGALRGLEIIADKRTIPFLKELPLGQVHQNDRYEYSSLFEKARGISERILLRSSE
jgi:hypothetical protein